MRFLDEHRRRPAALADHLPWAALVAPGVVLNKDGSFLAAFRFRGPDLESSTEDELMAVRARLNNALKRLGSGWCLHMEARRRPATAYPESAFDLEVAWLLDAERRSRFETADPAFETDFRLALTWLPPADETRRMERWLFDGLARGGHDWRLSLAAFGREADTTLDLLSDALSPVGAGGLTQLMPGTALELGVRDRFDPVENLRGGADYLARQIRRFGDLRLALAAYNAGPARVARLGRVPDIAETQAYVATVVDCYLALTAGQGITSSTQCRPRGAGR